MTTYRVRPEVAGSFGDATELDATTHPPLVSKLHYVFADWRGDDLVESFPCHLVTQRLAASKAFAGLTGYELRAVTVSIDPQALSLFPQLFDRFPSWYWIVVTGQPGDDLWLDDKANLYVSASGLRALQAFGLNNAEVVGA